MKTVRTGLIALVAGLSATTAAFAQGAYTIPAGLTPVRTWRDGYSAEESLRYRRAYDGGSLTEAGDVGAYAVVHIGEVLPTALVSRAGPVVELERAPMPESQDVTSPETDTVVVRSSSTYRNTLWVHACAREIVTSLFR